MKPISLLAAAVLAGTCGVCPARTPEDPPPPENAKLIRTTVQPRPGAPAEELDMAVHPVSTDLPLVGADDVDLEEDDLVLGVVVDGVAVAYPVRYLAMFEVIDNLVGTTPIAPSW